MSAWTWLFWGTAAVLLFWGIGAYNRVMLLRNEIGKAFTQLDDALTRRAALGERLLGHLREREVTPRIRPTDQEIDQYLRERQAQGQMPHFPILALTAHALDADVAASMDAGMDEHLTKPLDFVALRTRLQRWLNLSDPN